MRKDKFVITILALALVIGLGSSLETTAGEHYVSLSTVFPTGKCSAVSPYFEVLMAGFVGGEVSEYKIQDNKGAVIEVITTLINKDHNQWVTVVSKRDSKVIFCLFASGTGHGSVARQTIE